MNNRTYVGSIPEIAALLEGANHVDVKTFQSEKSMREFIAAALSYQPAWVTFLYGVRWFLVRLLGMKQRGVPRPTAMQPQDVPMVEGQRAYIFSVVKAEDDQYWFGEVAESHLTATLGVVAAPEQKQFHVVTVVHYNSWAGPVYFNVIRPFHHIVVKRMGAAGDAV